MPSTDIASQTRVKSSVQRGIRQALIGQIPLLGENDGALLEAIWPKKEALVHVKWFVFHVFGLFRPIVLLILTRIVAISFVVVAENTFPSIH